MSPPVQPVPDLNYWRGILHTAAAVPVGHPDYQDAQETLPYAKAQIQHLERQANIPDWEEATRAREVGPLAATGVGLMQGLSLGAGEPIAGGFSALTGGSFREGAERYREGLGEVQAQHPNLAFAGEMAGIAAPAFIPAGLAVKGLEAGKALTASQVGARLAQGVGGGATVGAISGFSAGGEDPGDIPARVQSGTRGAEIGAALGLLGTGAGLRLNRAHVERVADLNQRGTERALTQSRLAESQGRLARMSQPPEVVGHIDAGPVEDIGQALADFKAGKISQEDLDTALGYAVRPAAPADATLTPSPPRAPGPAVGPPSMRTVTPDPLAEPTFQRRGVAALGKGEQFPYYPRGGAEEQAMSPGPATPSGPPGHVAPLAPGQLKTLLDLSPKEFDAASGMLSPEMRAQIQELRAGGATGAHVEAAVGRMGAPSFSGGGFQGISEAMNTPAYQQAGTLAARILKDPKLLAQYPQFAGQNPEAATATLQRMLVEHARSGGTVPALTSLSRFLGRLSPPTRGSL